MVENNKLLLDYYCVDIQDIFSYTCKNIFY